MTTNFSERKSGGSGKYRGEDQHHVIGERDSTLAKSPCKHVCAVPYESIDDFNDVLKKSGLQMAIRNDGFSDMVSDEHHEFGRARWCVGKLWQHHHSKP
jgi:hypothetical protein